MFDILSLKNVGHLGERNDVIGSIKSSNGEIRILPSQTVFWASTGAGEQLAGGDSLYTGPKAEAKLHFSDGSDLLISPNSLVEFRRSDGSRIGSNGSNIFSIHVVKGKARISRNRSSPISALRSIFKVDISETAQEDVQIIEAPAVIATREEHPEGRMHPSEPPTGPSYRDLFILGDAQQALANNYLEVPFTWERVTYATGYELIIYSELDIQRISLKPSTQRYNYKMFNSRSLPTSYVVNAISSDGARIKGDPKAIRFGGHSPKIRVQPGLFFPDAQLRYAPIISWTPNLAAEGYEVQIAKSKSVIFETVINSSYTLIAPPGTPEGAQVRVRPLFRSSKGAWSEWTQVLI